MDIALSNRRKAGLTVGAAGFFLFAAFLRSVTAHRAPLIDALQQSSAFGSAAGMISGGAGSLSRGAAPSNAPGNALEYQAAEDKAAAHGLQRRMIREGSITLEVATRGEARGRALEAARRLDADVLNDEAAEGDGSGNSSMTFSVDPARLSQLVDALTPLGKVVSRQTTAQDVTEEWVDLEARLVNARVVRARLEELLRFKTTKLADVVLVERELERVGSELEQMEGRQKYLAARTDRARLCVRFLEKPKTVPVIAGFAASLKNGIDSAFGVFTATTTALLQLAGFALGLALWTVPISLLGWKAWKVWGPKAQ